MVSRPARLTPGNHVAIIIIVSRYDINISREENGKPYRKYSEVDDALVGAALTAAKPGFFQYLRAVQHIMPTL